MEVKIFFALAMLMKSNTLQTGMIECYSTDTDGVSQVLLQGRNSRQCPHQSGKADSWGVDQQNNSICTCHGVFLSNTTPWVFLMDSVMTMCSGSVKITPQPPLLLTPQGFPINLHFRPKTHAQAVTKSPDKHFLAFCLGMWLM